MSVDKERVAVSGEDNGAEAVARRQAGSGQCMWYIGINSV